MTAIRSIAQDVDKRGRKGATLGKRINRSPSATRDSHCWNSRKTWKNADARELTVNGEKDVPRPQYSAAIRDFATWMKIN